MEIVIYLFTNSKEEEEAANEYEDDFDDYEDDFESADEADDSESDTDAKEQNSITSEDKTSIQEGIIPQQSFLQLTQTVRFVLQLLQLFFLLN